MKVNVQVFYCGHFPWSKINFESCFMIKYYIITVLKKIGDFPLYFQILHGKGPGFIFMLECKFFHQMPCVNILNNRGGRQTWSFDFWLWTQGLPPGRILSCKILLVFHNGSTSNQRAGPILRWAQLQSEASWFTAVLLIARSWFVHNNLFQRLWSHYPAVTQRQMIWKVGMSLLEGHTGIRVK